MRLYLNRCRWAGCVGILGLLVPEFGTLLHANTDETRQGMESSPRAITFTGKDDRHEVSVPLGSTVILRLEAIPGTGYGWQLVQDGSPQLQRDGEPRFEPRSDVEAGGVEDEVFRFRAQATGMAELECVYRRPWEKQASGAKRFTIRIMIE
jgi:inhibitor of cysteine peptidase